MAKNSILDYSNIPDNNTDMGGIGIQGTSAVNNFDNAFRTLMSQLAEWTDASTIASTATTDLSTVKGMYVTISGASTITSFGTAKAGWMKFVRFTGPALLSHSLTGIILPDGTPIKTVPGDSAVVVSEGSGIWRCLSYFAIAATSAFSGFRNKIINGDLRVYARGSKVIAAGTSDYALDRFLITNNTNQPVTVSQQPMTPGQVAVPGNPRFKMRMAFANAPTSGTLRIEQRIEDVFTTAGNAASARAYLTGPTGTEALACEIVQNFGTGGSPSTPVTTSAASLDIATIYDATTQRRRAQFAVPSVSGRILGTNSNDYLSLAWTLTPRQAGNYEMARISFVAGDASFEDDPFAPRSIEEEIGLCQRFYKDVFWVCSFIATGAPQDVYEAVNFTTMRVPPVVTRTNGSFTNASLPVSVIPGRRSITDALRSLGAGTCFGSYVAILDAEL